MDFLNINETVQSVIRISKGVAREYGNASYAPAHLLFALMHKEVGLRSFVESLGKDADYLREWAEVRIEEYPKVSVRTSCARSLFGSVRYMTSSRAEWVI